VAGKRRPRNTGTRMPPRWDRLDDTTFVRSSDQHRWRLAATPQGKYPWLLTGRRTGAAEDTAVEVSQEIGVSDPEQARTVATAWIDWTTTYALP
jgi:hypothetical protein